MLADGGEESEDSLHQHDHRDESTKHLQGQGQDLDSLPSGADRPTPWRTGVPLEMNLSFDTASKSRFLVMMSHGKPINQKHEASPERLLETHAHAAAGGICAV